VVPDVSTGGYTRGLLSYLFGPGRHNEHTDPHIVAAFAMPGITDPGRVPLDQHHAALSDLAAYLDQPVKLREQRTRKPVPGHVWHCPVRTAPGDRYLTDEEWAEVARRIVHATGIAEHGDDAGCRWIAVRHAEDHIHIMATSVREDGRRPRNKRDGQRAQDECRDIERELGLRQLNSGDGTAPKTPTGAEIAKTKRTGRELTVRQWLRETAYAVAAASTDEAEFFDVLGTLGITVRPRIGPQTGEITGYSLAAPDDTDRQGEPVFYSGSSLAPDLSLTRLRERFTQPQPPPEPPASRGNGTCQERSWRTAEKRLRSTHTLILHAIDHPEDEGADAQVQAQAAALAELLHNTAATAPKAARAELRAAATAFNRAASSRIRAEHQGAYALRQAGKQLIRALPDGKDGDAVSAVLGAAIFVLIALSQWQNERGLRQQEDATRQTLTHLQAAYTTTATPALARLTQRTPSQGETARLAAAVRSALPDHADQVLTDPSWPALATALAQTESAGTPPHRALADVAARRELHSATHPAEVLLWRLRTTITDPATRRAQAAHLRTTTATRTTPAPVPTDPAHQAATGHNRRSR